MMELAAVERFRSSVKHVKMDQDETLETWFLSNERQSGDEVVQR